MYLLGSQNRLRHGGDTVALDYDAEEISLPAAMMAVFSSAATRQSVAAGINRRCEGRGPSRKRWSIW